MNKNTPKFNLPQQLGDTRLDLIQKILITILTKPQEITLNFHKNHIITAAGYAVMMSILDTACEQNVKIIITDKDKNNPVHQKIAELVDQMAKKKGFLDQHDMHYHESKRINIIKVSSIAPEIIQRLQVHFSETLSDDQSWIVQLIVNELMQNAVDHSTSERYYIYCGIHENDFEFGVLDNGVSIPSKMEVKYSESSDHLLIEKALQKDIGTRRQRSGGMGLFFLFESIKKEKGKIVLISRNGQIRRHFKHKSIISSSLKYPLHGTWCFARIPLDSKWK